MNTRDKLKALFDFQGFSKSEKLEGVINSTLKSVENQLNDSDLDMVNAAGYNWDNIRPDSDRSLSPKKKKRSAAENIWGKGQEGKILINPGEDSSLSPKRK